MKCGIVDVGSNTIRLSIYHWEGRNFKLLMNKKEMAGLAGYIKNGVLSDSGILVACRVLAGFKALLRNFDIDQIHVFGTASLRNIVNTEEALETIQAVTDLGVEVLTGAEEAAFSFQG
ncbi:phosphatase, partial [Pseudoflavonifractor phocaeensis]|nr:phosphatase [Pseudoflavonifractor phocaeensis]